MGVTFVKKGSKDARTVGEQEGVNRNSKREKALDKLQSG